MKTVNLPSVFFSKNHFSHSDYFEKNDKIYNISPNDLNRIKRISIIVGVFTLGIGGVLCYYIWTAKRKVDLFNELEKNGPSNIVDTGHKVKRVSDTIQLKQSEEISGKRVDSKSLLGQLKADPGYHPEWKNIPFTTLQANFMKEPVVGSYCFFPFEEPEHENVFKIVKVDKNKSDQIEFSVHHFQVTDKGFSFYYPYQNDRPDKINPTFYSTLSEFFNRFKQNHPSLTPISQIDESLTATIELKYNIEELEEQIKNDPAFYAIKPKEIPFNEEKGSYCIYPAQEDKRENLYVLEINGLKSLFWASNHGFLKHMNVHYKNADEQILGVPFKLGIGDLKEYLVNQGALHPYQVNSDEETDSDSDNEVI